MAKTIEMKLPSFKKGHTHWNPKAKDKDGMIVVNCGTSGVVTAPHTGVKKTDEKAVADAVRVYAKAHGWVEGA